MCARPLPRIDSLDAREGWQFSPDVERKREREREGGGIHTEPAWYAALCGRSTEARLAAEREREERRERERERERERGVQTVIEERGG